ncbi:MAG: aspartate 1-decarboxylase [Chloroflexi bacterium]|nr:aspartate 1-decarboxylase [Chloroflexota bacterium]
MMRTMLGGKIHRATVTEANLHYQGSITLDPDLLEAADILPYEMVHILDLINGARLETYALEGERGTGEVCINGAAAHLVHKGDLVIILHYATVSEAEARKWRPSVVFVDEDNKIVSVSQEVVPGPFAAAGLYS